MKAKFLSIVIVLAFCVTLRAEQQSPDNKNELSDKAKVENDAKFHQILLAIAKHYRTYKRVDDLKRWAPELCGSIDNDKIQASTSKDENTHGRKLYHLYAADAIDYLQLARDFNPKVVLPGAEAAHQVVVKESWVPQEIQKEKADKAESLETLAKLDGKFYKKGKQSDLFIMFQLDKEIPNTDEGWVYGTVTPDGKTVTSSGCVKSCMECHVQAPRGRLFGLAKIKDDEAK